MTSKMQSDQKIGLTHLTQLFVMAVTFLTTTAAHASAPAKSTHEMILSREALVDLSLEHRIDYTKFLLGLLGEWEELQNEQLRSQKNDAALGGQKCLAFLQAGLVKNEKSSGWLCEVKMPKHPDCGTNRVSCAPLEPLISGASEVCVNASAKANYTKACVVAVQKAYAKQLDKHIGEKFVKNRATTFKQWDAWSETLRQAFIEAENTALFNGLNDKSPTIQRLKKVYTAVVEMKVLVYRNNDLNLNWSAKMDSLPLPAPRSTPGLVDYLQFKKWDNNKQKQYMNGALRAWVEFEKANRQTAELAEHQATPFDTWAQWLPDLFWPEAFADDGDLFCVIGGVRRALVTNGSKKVCPTKGRTCGGADTFKCGVVFNNACVSRKPIDNISEACFEKAHEGLPDRKTYEAKRADFKKVVDSCQNAVVKKRSSLACDRFSARLAILNEKFGASPSPSFAEAIDPTKPRRLMPVALQVAEEGTPTVDGTSGSDPARDEIPVDPVDLTEPGSSQPRVNINDQSGQGTGTSKDDDPIDKENTPVEPPTSDCQSKYEAKLGVLACVACGLEAAQGQNGVGHWVALIGAMAQTYHGPYNVNDPRSVQALQTRAIEMVSSYGYCTDAEYPVNAGAIDRGWIDGSKPLRGGLFSSGNEETRFSETFGLMSGYRNLFSESPSNSGAPLLYAEQLFNDTDPANGFDEANPQERQARFRAMAHAHAGSFKCEPGQQPGSKVANKPKCTAFSMCAKQIVKRIKTSPGLMMCSVKSKKSSGGGIQFVYPAKISAAELAQNDALYGAMMSACGLPTQRKFKDKYCDNGCWSSTVYQTSVNIGSCQTSKGNKQNKGPDRPTPRSERSEPSTPRGSYGSEAESQRSDGARTTN